MMNPPLTLFTNRPCHQHHCASDQEDALLNQMQPLMRAGTQQLDTLRAIQIAAQEALGVIAATMLWQQGVMWDVSIWESEVEAEMWEMERMVKGESSL